MDTSEIIKQFMARALKLAKRADGNTSPNPMVGAVLVKNGQIIGEGYHHRAGAPHAEIDALKSARVNVRGSTLFINLEPCCFHGKTPPCTETLVKSGIKEIYCAMVDPNPKVNGKGIKILGEAGIKVHLGLMEREARRLNMVYEKYINRGIPFVTLKWASSLDGKIATDTGESQWITCERSRKYVHMLRSKTDAILVGRGTVVADNPSLTVRHGYKRTRPLYRIIMDENFQVPSKSAVLRENKEYPTIIVVGDNIDHVKCKVDSTTVEFLQCKRNPSGVDPEHLLELLGQKHVTSLLVEGGPRVSASFIKHNLVDRLLVFIAPRIIGGTAPSAVAPINCHYLDCTPEFMVHQIRKLGQDTLLELYSLEVY